MAVLSHQEPDRVPMDLGATRNTGIVIEAYDALVKFLGIGGEHITEADAGLSKVLRLATPSETVLRKLDVDFRGVYLGKPDHPLGRMFPDGSYEDELGVIRRRPPGSYYYDVVQSPFDGDITVADISKWEWPDPTDPGYVRGLGEEVLELRQTTDHAIVLHLQDIVVHSSQYMRGFERWYMDFALQPKLICALMDALLERRIVVTERALRQVGDLIDVVSCSDDVADQRGPIISPEMYRRYIKPRHRRYFESLQAHTAAKILYHSCGSVVKLIPDFIDMGIDYLNPVQVSAAGMDTALLKREYGKKIGFWGAIDTMRVLPFGKPHEVAAEVRRRIRDLSPGGGYVLAAVHNIQPNVPPENIVAMYEAAHEFGV